MNYRIIYTRPEDGGVSVICPAPGVAQEDAAKAVPAGVPYQVIDVADVPADREFRNAWKFDNGIKHDMGKAREIAHARRRAARAAEFAPLDVKATIPAEAAKAEADRKVVRDKYASMQIGIDAAGDVQTLSAALK